MLWWHLIAPHLQRRLSAVPPMSLPPPVLGSEPVTSLQPLLPKAVTASRGWGTDVSSLCIPEGWALYCPFCPWGSARATPSVAHSLRPDFPPPPVLPQLLPSSPGCGRPQLRTTHSWLRSSELHQPEPQSTLNSTLFKFCYLDKSLNSHNLSFLIFNISIIPTSQLGVNETRWTL